MTAAPLECRAVIEDRCCGSGNLLSLCCLSSGDPDRKRQQSSNRAATRRQRVDSLLPSANTSTKVIEVLRLGLVRRQSENLHHYPRACQDQSMMRSTQPGGPRNLRDRSRELVFGMPVLVRTQTAAGSLMRAADFELDSPVPDISGKSNLRGRTLSLHHTLGETTQFSRLSPKPHFLPAMRPASPSVPHALMSHFQFCPRIGSATTSSLSQPTSDANSPSVSSLVPKRFMVSFLNLSRPG